MPRNSAKFKNTSFSSVETQRKLRIEKSDKLRAKGSEPFQVRSKRDYEIGFIKFWFNFLFKFDLENISDDINEFDVYYFMENVLFPQSLVEQMEEKVQLRSAIKEMGLDPDEAEGKINREYDSELIKEARELLFDLANTPEEKRMEYFHEMFDFGNPETLEDLSEQDFDYRLRLSPEQTVTLAGRIKSKRVSGKIAFATIEDESCPSGFQFIFKKDDLDQTATFADVSTKQGDFRSLNFDDFKKLVDEGDYIQATGKLDYSQRGEPSLFVTDLKFLTKALRPLPETWEAENLESRYLDRVVDFKMNTKDKNDLSVREMFYLKSKFWQIWREELLNEDFLEVECPIFEQIPGGAEARPFTTYYNELEQEMYLRISLELPLKKLISGGFERVFEIGRIFRNEGSSPQHLQEYTQIEWYGSYNDYFYGMKLTQKIYRRLANEILGTLMQTDYKGNQINWGEWISKAEAKKQGWEVIGGWPLVPYYDAMRYFSQGKVDVENKTEAELLKMAKSLGADDVNIDVGKGALMDKIWKKIRHNVLSPIFLVLPPVELEPLAKRNPKNQNLAERFQVVAGGAELGKGFSELNDPIDQFGRFTEQQESRDKGNEEAQFMDENYVKALEYGTPPMVGFGVSERLFSFFLGKHIKECVTFPHVKKAEDGKKKKEKTMIAHAILLVNEDQPLWSQMNTAAHLSASLAAREGRQLIEIDQNTTLDGVKIPMNIRHAIIMKKTHKIETLRQIKAEAEKQGLTITAFTEEMRDSSNDKKVTEKQTAKKNAEINYLGIMIYGKKGSVEKLTDEFERV